MKIPLKLFATNKGFINNLLKLIVQFKQIYKYTNTVFFSNLINVIHVIEIYDIYTCFCINVI